MPSDKKRINLTVPDDVYQRIQEYKSRKGITNDASACLQMIVQQLDSEKNMAILLDTIQKSNMDSLLTLTKEGFDFMKQLPSTGSED